MKARDARSTDERSAARAKDTDAWPPKIEDWLEASKGRLRADVAQRKLTAMGDKDSERSIRCAATRGGWSGNMRWAPALGDGVRARWLQDDFGDRPLIDGQGDVARGLACPVPVPDRVHSARPGRRQRGQRLGRRLPMA